MPIALGVFFLGIWGGAIAARLKHVSSPETTPAFMAIAMGGTGIPGMDLAQALFPTAPLNLQTGSQALSSSRFPTVPTRGNLGPAQKQPAVRYSESEKPMADSRGAILVAHC